MNATRLCYLGMACTHERVDGGGEVAMALGGSKLFLSLDSREIMVCV
jgi:hypothetical protein